MMNNTSRRLVNAIAMACAAGALGVSGASEARADIVRAKMTYTNLVVANVVSPDLTGNVNTTTFHWERTDAPGPGVDATLPDEFVTFCIDISQTVRSNTNYNYQVLTPAEAGWDSARTVAMQTLWSEYLDDVTSPQTSAAFQLAVWEIFYDTDRNIQTGAFRASAPDTAKTIAQNWLSSLGTIDIGNRALPELAILTNDDVQDQLTLRVPAPGAGMCALTGIALLGGRRRRA